jgi:hypothetical protein
MMNQYIVVGILQALIICLGISLGKSLISLKLRKEENKRRELELSLLEKRSEILQQGKQIAHDLEEVLYKAHIQQEIDNIIRKSGPSK